VLLEQFTRGQIFEVDGVQWAGVQAATDVGNGSSVSSVLQTVRV